MSWGEEVEAAGRVGVGLGEVGIGQGWDFNVPSLLEPFSASPASATFSASSPRWSQRQRVSAHWRRLLIGFNALDRMLVHDSEPNVLIVTGCHRSATHMDCMLFLICDRDRMYESGSCFRVSPPSPVAELLKVVIHWHISSTSSGIFSALWTAYSFHALP